MVGWGDDPETGRNVGQRLKQWRLILGLSQELVAARARTTRQTLARLENGDETVGTGVLWAVIDVLGLSQRVMDAVEPLNTDLGRARADKLGRQRAPKTEKW